MARLTNARMRSDAILTLVTPCCRLIEDHEGSLGMSDSSAIIEAIVVPPQGDYGIDERLEITVGERGDMQVVHSAPLRLYADLYASLSKRVAVTDHLSAADGKYTFSISNQDAEPSCAATHHPYREGPPEREDVSLRVDEALVRTAGRVTVAWDAVKTKEDLAEALEVTEKLTALVTAVRKATKPPVLGLALDRRILVPPRRMIGAYTTDNAGAPTRHLRVWLHAIVAGDIQ